MFLIGSAGWWMPKWLDRVTPKLSIEGNEWFAEHESRIAARPNVQQESSDEHVEHKSAD
jgi:hypothetical protein